MIVIDELLKLNLRKIDENKDDTTTDSSSNIIKNLPLPSYIQRNPKSEVFFFQRVAEKVLQQQTNNNNNNNIPGLYKINMGKLDRYCLTGRPKCLFKK